MKGAKSKAAPMKSGSKLGVKPASRKTKAAAKDPNKPKRPPSAFFVFMEGFRTQFKENNPANKSVAVVGKAGGEKWKSMTAEEKAPYVAKAEKRKTEYTKVMQAYNKKLSEGPKESEEDESDKSKSEVNDEDDDGNESYEDADEDDAV